MKLNVNDSTWLEISVSVFMYGSFLLSLKQDDKDKIEEYQAENRLPDDEMENFYVHLRKKFARFWNVLAEEWENEHRGKL